MPVCRKLFYRLVSPLAAIPGFNFILKIAPSNTLFLLYHGVSEEPSAHTRFLYRMLTADEFRRHLDFLLRHFIPADLHSVIGSDKNDKPEGRWKFHLCFDDGLREFHDYAAPILLEKGVPATCFLNNDFIDNRAMMYRLKISLLTDRLHSSKQGDPAWKAWHEWLEKFVVAPAYYRTVLNRLTLSDSESIDNLAGMLGIDFNGYLDKIQPYLTTGQIHSLIGKGFTFGSHSPRHARPEVAHIDKLTDLVRHSVDDVVRRFGLSYRVFSFPFSDKGISGKTIDRLHAGAALDLSFGCAGIKDPYRNRHFQRFPMEVESGDIAGVLKKELLYYLFLKSIGRSRLR